MDVAQPPGPCPFGACSPHCSPDQDRHVRTGDLRIDPEGLDDPVAIHVVHEADHESDGPGTYMYSMGGHIYSRSQARQLLLDYLALEEALPDDDSPRSTISPWVEAN